MGKAIEALAIQRGHHIASIVRSENKYQISDFVHEADVAIEFTQPESAVENIITCLEHNTPIVSGTTGWSQYWDEVKKIQELTEGAMVWASNFSVGVNILFQINQRLAQIMSQQSQFNVEIEEIHHLQKKDAPSGTALTLTQGILQNIDRYSHWNLTTDPGSINSIPIHSIRKEGVVGYHEVTYKSEIDEIKISHNAFTRDGFALGAIIAAEWVIGKKGIFSMKEVLF